RAFAGVSGGTAFVPRGWMLCDGTILDIRQHIPLFAILRDAYGGDGIQTFALPDLRGRLPVGTGAATGRPAYNLGQRAGTDQVATQAVTVSPVGNNATVNSVAPGPLSNVEPVLSLSYIICVEGAFPTNR